MATTVWMLFLPQGLGIFHAPKAYMEIREAGGETGDERSAKQQLQAASQREWRTGTLGLKLVRRPSEAVDNVNVEIIASDGLRGPSNNIRNRLVKPSLAYGTVVQDRGQVVPNRPLLRAK